MEKALKIIQDSLASNLSLADDYNKKARFHLFDKDLKEAEYNRKSADRFLKRASECESAIEELKAIA